VRRRKDSPREGLVSLGDLVEGAIKALGVQGEYESIQVAQRCREILGEAASKALLEVSWSKGKVGLKFDHSIWLNEMNFRKAEVLARLQKDLPGLGIKSVDLGLARKPKS